MTISRTTFDPAKQYKRVRFHEDRDLLDSELNELQEIAIQERRALFDGVYAQGTILAGLTATVDGDQLTLAAGRVYLDGHAVAVPGGVVTVSGAGEQTLWVDVFQRDVGVAEDPALVNPLTGEPTAEREKWIASLQTRDTTGDPLPDGASRRLVVAILTYHGETGVLTPLQPRPLSSADGTRLDACAQQLQEQAETLAALDEASEAHIGAGGDAHALVTPEAAGFMSGPQKVLLESLALAPPAHTHDARYYTEAETDAKLTQLAVPIGTIHLWTNAATIPNGWLDCDGQAVSRSAFSELFAVVGIGFGAGDGTTTFNVPDLRGEFIRGWDQGRGVDAGRALGSWQADDLKSHEHAITGSSSGGDNPWGGVEKRICTDNEVASSGTFAYLTAAPTGGVETRPRNIALRYLIRAKQVAGTDPLVQEANADTVDGFHASAFAVAGHRHDELYLLKLDAVPAYLVEMARVTTTTLATFMAATRYPHGLAYTSRGELFMHHHLVDNYPLSLCWSMIVEAKEATSITMQLQDNANTLAVYVDGTLAWTRAGGYALATYTIALTAGEHRVQVLTGGLGITDLWINLNGFLSQTVVWKRAATS